MGTNQAGEVFDYGVEYIQRRDEVAAVPDAVSPAGWTDQALASATLGTSPRLPSQGLLLRLTLRFGTLMDQKGRVQMMQQPAALYGPSVGGQDETVAAPTRVLLAQGAPVLAGFLAGAEAVVVASRTPGYSAASSSVWAIALLVLSGWALVSAGVLLLRKAENRAAGVLLSLAGITWLIAEWDSPGARSALVFGAGVVMATVTPVLVAQRRTQNERRLGAGSRRLQSCSPMAARWLSRDSAKPSSSTQEPQGVTTARRILGWSSIHRRLSQRSMS